jgi:hypothetical protein
VNASSKKRKQRGRVSIWRVLRIIGLLVVTLAVAGLVYLFYPRPVPQSEPLALDTVYTQLEQLKFVSAFDSIADPRVRSVALFTEIGRVLQNPRCMNCHPRTERPTQTSAMRSHMPWVSRGVDGGGEPNMRCTTCHNEQNVAASSVPGNPKWRLAPVEMAWQGKTLGEICEQLLDPTRSHMDRDALLHHMAEDELVGWAWAPGGNRTPAPGTQAEFGSLVEAWLETGAACPQ